jgi:uncharacterized coiled-coil DUF342 family protein
MSEFNLLENRIIKMEQQIDNVSKQLDAYHQDGKEQHEENKKQHEELKQLIKEIENKKADKSVVDEIRGDIKKIVWIVLTAVALAVLKLVIL